MKPRQAIVRTTLPLLLAFSFLLLSCSLFTPSTGLPATQNLPGTGQTPLAPLSSEPIPAGETPEELAASPQPEGFDVSQAGLPPGVPIYPSAHDFSGVPGVMVQYTADADVVTASAFYDKAMKADGWTGFSTGGASQGECGGDCGPGNPTPTPTPGPKPTATPPGFMNQNTQLWTKGTSQIMIMYTANIHGGTDIVITITAK